MRYQSAVNQHIVIGDQPSEADLTQLKNQGFVGVVNLRTDGEPEQPLGTAEEGELVRELGLDYLHAAVDQAGIGPDDLKNVQDFLTRHAEEKVLVHCRKGGRAAAVVLIAEALRHGWNAQEALERGPRMGLNVDGGLRMMVERILSGS
jgi:uncharacterized protein (TIGR01244 family)